MSSPSGATASAQDSDFCFLRVSIAGAPPERIVIQLFRSIAPKTCQNFWHFCQAPGRTTPQKPTPTYRGSIVHRIVPQFMVQGGDFDNFNGTGGHAAAGRGHTFPDESFHISHDRAGIVSMANRGKDTNGSQFFITLQPTPHLNHKHVAFGQVIEGMTTVQRMATDVELDGTRPSALQKIVIVDCGMGKGGDADTSSSNDADEEEWNRKRPPKKDKKSKSDKKKRKKKERRRPREEDSTSPDSEDESRRRKRRSKKKSRRSKGSRKSNSRRQRGDSDSSVSSASTA